MVILDLDERENLQNNSVETNIKYVINKYAHLNKDKIKPFNKYYIKYNFEIKFKNKVIYMIINIKKNQLKSNITYNFVTIDKNEESKNWYNADDRNENDSTLPGLFITFLDKDYDKNDAYIHFIAKNEKQNIESGTNAIQLAIRLCKYLNVRYAYLEDDSKIKCEMPRDLSLTLFKLLTTGNTWYEKHGFKFDVKKYNHIKLAIKKVQNIKIIDVIKTVKNIRDALQNTIKSGKYSEFKCWSPFVSEIADHEIQPNQP